MDDPYKLLGVSKDATADQIKSSYRKLARTLHPDLNPGDKAAEEKFKKVTAAYDLLGDAAKRARYDAGEIDGQGNEKRSYRRHSSAGAGGGGFGGGFGNFKFGDNADDIFSELLRRKGKNRAGAGPGGKFWFEEEDADQPQAGGNAQYSLKVTFPEAAMGTTKRINLPTGKSLDVKVPPGSKDGTTLRLKGQGNPGRNGGPAGDALIEVKVEPHAYFTREGDDVLITLPISLAEAVMGGKVTVPTVDGKVALNIPANSSGGVVMRLKGKGIPHGKGRGDQLVTLKIVLPEKPDAELEQFLKGWAAKHGYNPRQRAGME